MNQFFAHHLELTEEETLTLRELGEGDREVVDISRISAVKARRQESYRSGISRREVVLATTKISGFKLLSPHNTLGGKQCENIFEELVQLKNIIELNEGLDLGPILLFEGMYFECDRRDWYYPKSIVTFAGRYVLRERRFHVFAFDLGAIRSELSEERIYTLTYSI